MMEDHGYKAKRNNQLSTSMIFPMIYMLASQQELLERLQPESHLRLIQHQV